jgi:hypothetical protein
MACRIDGSGASVSIGARRPVEEFHRWRGCGPLQTLDIHTKIAYPDVMIERHQLPEDAADWRDVVVDFPRLKRDDPSESPFSEDEVFSYVRLESADLDNASRSRLRFIRTAQVCDQKFWLWEYLESDGVEMYVFTAQGGKGGRSIVSLTEKNGLSPEQYMLAEHYDEVYWS